METGKSVLTPRGFVEYLKATAVGDVEFGARVKAQIECLDTPLSSMGDLLSLHMFWRFKDYKMLVEIESSLRVVESVFRTLRQGRKRSYRWTDLDDALTAARLMTQAVKGAQKRLMAANNNRALRNLREKNVTKAAFAKVITAITPVAYERPVRDEDRMLIEKLKRAQKEEALLARRGLRPLAATSKVGAKLLGDVYHEPSLEDALTVEFDGDREAMELDEPTTPQSLDDEFVNSFLAPFSSAGDDKTTGDTIPSPQALQESEDTNE
jgi:hypothetical protein